MDRSRIGGKADDGAGAARTHAAGVLRGKYYTPADAAVIRPTQPATGLWHNRVCADRLPS